MLAKASTEQNIIINAIKTNNVKVNSVAGSGKTTTVLHMAKELCKESILLLTYNARLKLETRKRKTELGLNNLSVDSYHSFCVGNYNRKCFKDSVIIKILDENSKPLKKFSYLSLTRRAIEHTWTFRRTSLQKNSRSTTALGVPRALVDS